MNYLSKKEWKIVPDAWPKVERYCSKCGRMTHFICSRKFRVNANGNLLDVWLIYTCEVCGQTWNFPIYERKNKKTIGCDAYHKFLVNDADLAACYAFDVRLFRQKQVNILLGEVPFHVLESSEEENVIEDMHYIWIYMPYPLDIRLDRLLAEQFSLSRSLIKRLCQMGQIKVNGIQDANRAKVRDGMEIIVSKK